MRRRTFLALASTSLGGLGAALVARDLRLGAAFAPTPPAAPPRALTPARWRILEAAQDVLLPSAPGSPGARDVHAIGYLDAVLAAGDVDADERETLETGADRLQQLAAARGATDFAALDATARAELLTALQGEPDGESWFELVLAFTLEAFLGDPSHGGNPQGIGWAWLGHEPGWPRPAAKEPG